MFFGIPNLKLKYTLIRNKTCYALTKTKLRQTTIITLSKTKTNAKWFGPKHAKWRL